MKLSENVKVAVSCLSFKDHMLLLFWCYFNHKKAEYFMENVDNGMHYAFAFREAKKLK